MSNNENNNEIKEENKIIEENSNSNNNNEIKEKNNKNLETIPQKEDSPIYSDSTKKIYKINNSPIISSIIILKTLHNPITRCYLTCEYSSQNNSIICVGGTDQNSNQFNKITEYNINKNEWIYWKINNQSELDLELSGHSSNLVVIDNEEKIFIFGGYDNWKHEFTAQSYLINIKMKNFEKINYYNLPSLNTSYDNFPLPRTYHTSNYDKENNLIYIYGGTDMNINHCKEENFQALWSFNLNQKIWKKIILKNIPNDGAPRGHSSILLNNKLYIFGGVTSFKKFNNFLYIIKLDENIIEKIDYSDEKFKKGIIPPPMAFHSSVCINNNKILIHGGLDKNYNAINSIFIYYINDFKFEKIFIPLIPNLFGHKIVFDENNKNNLYIIGGMNDFKKIGDENLVYKIDENDDNNNLLDFNKNENIDNFEPMSNILIIKLNNEDDNKSKAIDNNNLNNIENNNQASNNNIKNQKIKRWKKLFYTNI